MLRRKKQEVERGVVIHVIPDTMFNYQFDENDQIKVMVAKPGWGWIVFPDENGKVDELASGTEETKDEALEAALAWAQNWLPS